VSGLPEEAFAAQSVFWQDEDGTWLAEHVVTEGAGKGVVVRQPGPSIVRDEQVTTVLRELKAASR
jgi:hypothetical protein